tara:strand:+ start:112 stop:822 length:711 start_codon:yes stop_codon:yes gene_type:complete
MSGDGFIGVLSKKVVNVAWAYILNNYRCGSMKLKATIIIPFDVERGYLDLAIKSVERQTYENIELIVEQGEHSWPTQANRAIEKCTGDIIRYLQEDDLLPDRSIEHTVKFFQENDVDFIHSNAVNFWEDGREQFWVPKSYQHPTLEQMITKNRLHGGSVVYRKRCFDERMFDESLWTGEEWEFNMYLLQSGRRIGYMNEFTYMYRRHDNQKSLGKNVSQKKRYAAFEEIRNRFRVK